MIIVVVIGFNLPFSSSGVPWEDDFEWSLFNYTPVVTGGLFVIVGLWWLVSARKTFKGPRTRSRTSTAKSRSRGSMTATLEVLEPATEAVLAEIPRAGVEEADAAVARAKAAYPAWRAVAPADRAALLHRLADALDGEREDAGAARGAQRRQADRRRARRDGDGGRHLPLLRGAGRSGCSATRSRWPAASG